MKPPSIASIQIPTSAVFAYFFYIALGLAVGVLLIFFIGRQFGGSITFLIGNSLLYAAAVFGHFRFAHGVSDWPPLEKGSLGKTIAWGLFMALVGYVVVAYVSGAWMQNLQGLDDSLHLRPEAQFRATSHYLNGTTARMITALDICIVAPIAEEIIFRSGVFRILKGRFSVTTAAAVSAVLFAISHRSVVAAVPFLVLGYLCCWTYEKTADIRGPIVMHTGYNLIVTVPVLLGTHR